MERLDNWRVQKWREVWKGDSIHRQVSNFTHKSDSCDDFVVKQFIMGLLQIAQTQNLKTLPPSPNLHISKREKHYRLSILRLIVAIGVKALEKKQENLKGKEKRKRKNDLH